MQLNVSPAQIPLAPDESGTFRVGGTRVTLDSVVYAYLQGETPEEIAQHYPVVALADIYFVLGYYLNHRAEVEDYLRARKAEAETLREQHQGTHGPSAALRERLLARRREKAG